MMYQYRVHGAMVYANCPIDILSPVSIHTVRTVRVGEQEYAANGVTVHVVELGVMRAHMPGLKWDAMAWNRGESSWREWHRQRLPLLSVVETPHGPAIYMYSGADDHEFVALIGLDGARIDIGWTGYQGVTAQECRKAITTYWLPTLLGMAMRLGGHLVLHGNALDVDGRAVVWCGEKGAGKSTLAAACVAAGYTLLADDQVVLRQADDVPSAHEGESDSRHFCVEPGVDQMRLWKSSQDVLSAFPDSQGLEIYYPLGSDIKGLMSGRSVKADVTEQPQPVLLAAVCILAPRDPRLTDAKVQLLGSLEAVSSLITSRFGGARLPLPRALLVAELAGYTQLIKTVSVYSVTLPDAMDRLPSVVEQLVALTEMSEERVCS